MDITLFFPFEIEKKYEEEGKWVIEGIAAVSGIEGDRNVPKVVFTDQALAKAVNDLQVNNILFFEHDRSNPIGKIIHSIYQNGKLLIKGIISKSAERIWQLIREGILTGLSVGVTIKKIANEWVKGENVTKVLDMTINEVSVVSLSGNLNTRILNWYVEKALMKGGEQMGNEFPVDENVGGSGESKTEITQPTETKAEVPSEITKQETIGGSETVTETPKEGETPTVQETEKTAKDPIKDALTTSSESLTDIIQNIDKYREDKTLVGKLQKLVGDLQDVIARILGYYYYYYEEKKSFDTESLLKMIEKDLDKKVREIVIEILKEIPLNVRKSASTVQTESDENLSTEERLRRKLEKIYNKT